MINYPQVYIAIAIVVLAIISIFVIYVGKNRKQKKPSGLAYFALLLVILGMFFEDRLPAYGLMGAGALLAVIGIIRDLRTSKGI
jgi:hypothetical protein